MTIQDEAVRPCYRIAEHSPDAFKSGAGFVDGLIVPIAAAKIPIQDLGFLHSDATYDVVHTWKKRFFRLDDHLDRFFSGIEKLHMQIPFTRDQVREILHQCTRITGLDDAYVEMICTRGIAAPGSRDPRRCENKFYAFTVPFSWVATPEQQDHGISLHISTVQRIAPESVDPSVKNYHWLDLIKAQYETYETQALVPALVDAGGHVTEGPGFNVFIVKGDDVITPDRGMLRGITRRTALELAVREGLKTQERPVHTSELLTADEVFLTSTAGGIIPVREVDGQTIGTGRSPIAQRLRTRYWEAHTDPAFSEPV